MQPVGGSTQADPPAEGNSREQLISRSVALKAAVNTSMTEDKKPAEVIEIAEEFERWLKEK